MNYLENPINKTDTLFISKNVLFKSNALYMTFVFRSLVVGFFHWMLYLDCLER